MTVSVNLKADAWAQESNLPLVLLTIDHAEMEAPIRVVNNNENITSNGNEFIAYPFEISLPDSTEDAPPAAQLKIDNVAREIAQVIRELTVSPTVLIQVVRQEDYDTVEIEFPAMTLDKVTVDALTVSGNLIYEDLSREPYPAYSFNPAEFPGLVS